MPGQHSEEENQRLAEEIQAKSDANPGGESQDEMVRRIAEEHAKRLKESIQGQQMSHVPDPPRSRTDGPLDEPVIHHGVGGKAGTILQKLEVDEPVFVLRAKDIFSTMVIAKYLEIVEAYGPSDHEFQRTITETLQDFKDWQGSNTDKVRYPD